MPTYRLDIAYDGTGFAGWQIQPGQRTVQEELEKALSVLVREKVRLTGAGRTDAGVHAQGQVASFQTQTAIANEQRTLHALNCILDLDVSVRALARASDGFNARFSARFREYAYTIILSKSPLQRDLEWHLRYRVDWDLVASLVPMFMGSHDFSAFCASGSESRDRRCEVLFFSLETTEVRKVFHIRANRFLYRMVRSIVGTLVDIGRGELPRENLAEALKTGDRRLVGDTAPAKGLTLVEVGY